MSPGVHDCGGERITNVGTPTNPDHAATKAYVDSGSSPLTVATVTLTNAQILTLPSTPIAVVPAQGANTMIVPISATYLVNPFTTSYTNLAGNIVVALDAANNFNQMTAGIAASVLLAAFGNHPVVGVDPGATLNLLANNQSYIVGSTTNGYNNTELDVAATTGSGNFGGGHSAQTLTVSVVYYVATIA